MGDILTCDYPLWKTSLPTWELQVAIILSPLNMPPKRALCPRSTPVSQPPPLPVALFAPLLARSATRGHSRSSFAVSSIQFSCSVVSESFETPWSAAHQASLSITNSQSLLKLMSTELVMPSNHLILCHPLPLLPSIFPRFRVFSNESALRIRWPKYCH